MCGFGLIGFLLVGLILVVGLGMGWDILVIGVNYLCGYLCFVDLEEQCVEYLVIILLVFGGYIFLVYMQSNIEIELLGFICDDFVGEVYDKVSCMLDLGYFGGLVVDCVVKQGNFSILFSWLMLYKGLEFFFFGLKFVVVCYLDSLEEELVVEDVVVFFVEVVMEILLIKCCKVLEKYLVKFLVVVGGVVVSLQLREQVGVLCEKMGVELCLLLLWWLIDNVVMIVLVIWDYLCLGKYIEVKLQL